MNHQRRKKYLIIIVCTPESFITNISHQLFDCKITFVNSQHENINLKGTQNPVLNVRFKNKSDSDLG